MGVEVGIIRSEERDGKRDIHCPLCSFRITLKREKPSIGAMLGVDIPRYKIYNIVGDVNPYDANRYSDRDFEAVMSEHIASHTPAEIVRQSIANEDHIANCEATIRAYSDYVRYNMGFIHTKNEMTNLITSLQRAHIPIPNEVSARKDELEKR